MAVTIQDRIGHVVGRTALGVLEEMRVDLQRNRRIGMADAVLDLSDRRASRNHRRRAQL